MRIVADRNIPFVQEAFGPLGEVVTVSAPALDAAAVQDADLVLVRSTVKVDAALLSGSRARFVATATIGTDHLDTAWLAERGIAWASAPGSNADSVAQWWAGALLTLAERRRTGLRGATIGIVGVGNVGSRVERLAAAFGCRVLRCDPPRARAEGGDFVALDDLLPACDVVTLHVPLARGGSDPTFRLLDAARLERLRPSATLVNCSRGAVLHEAAAVKARAAGHLGALLLDVFEGEPEVAPATVAACDLATPHIAGHSLDGKANGTRMIHEAACRFLGVAPKWSPRTALGPKPTRSVALDTRGLDDETVALSVLRRFYRVEEDDAALRRIARLPDGKRGKAFGEYRASYPPRRELHGLRVQMAPARPFAGAMLEALGAVIEDRG